MCYQDIVFKLRIHFRSLEMESNCRALFFNHAFFWYLKGSAIFWCAIVFFFANRCLSILLFACFYVLNSELFLLHGFYFYFLICFQFKCLISFVYKKITNQNTKKLWNKKNVFNKILRLNKIAKTYFVIVRKVKKVLKLVEMDVFKRIWVLGKFFVKW